MLIFNTVTKTKEVIEIGLIDFVISCEMPPFLFIVMRDVWIETYKIGEKGGVEVAGRFRMSKLEPRAVSRFNKGYFVGGYNRGFLPGNKRTLQRSIYYVD